MLTYIPLVTIEHTDLDHMRRVSLLVHSSILFESEQSLVPVYDFEKLSSMIFYICLSFNNALGSYELEKSAKDVRWWHVEFKWCTKLYSGLFDIFFYLQLAHGYGQIEMIRAHLQECETVCLSRSTYDGHH